MFREINKQLMQLHYQPKRNQSSLLFLHSITVARIACTTLSSTCVLAFRQHSSTARHPYTSETHRHNYYSLLQAQNKHVCICEKFVCIFICVFLLSSSCQLTNPAVAKATRFSLSSLLILGQSTWSVFSLLWDTGNKLVKHRKLWICNTATKAATWQLWVWNPWI